MPREAEPSLNEREFILQALRENLRIDARPFDAVRDLELSFGDEFGVVDVKWGKTRYTPLLRLIYSRQLTFIARVIARISAEVTQPFPDRKFDGIFTITTELSPMASPAFEVGRYADLPFPYA